LSDDDADQRACRLTGLSHDVNCVLIDISELTTEHPALLEVFTTAQAGPCRDGGPFLVVFLADHPSTYRTAGLRWGTATSSSTRTGTTSPGSVRFGLAMSDRGPSPPLKSSTRTTGVAIRYRRRPMMFKEAFEVALQVNPTSSVLEHG
jgi:hypothetical protein